MANGNRGVIIITLMNSWQYVGISMVIYMAGLQNIPKMYLEAAEIDGASPWQRFCRITLPLLLPSISSAVVLNLIGGLKLYDIIISLSEGGPGFSTHSLASYVSNQYFNAQNAGYSLLSEFSPSVYQLVSNLFTTYFNRKEVGHGMKKEFKRDWWKYLLGLAIIIFHVLPMYVLIVMAFKSMSDSSSFLSLPQEIYTQNFIEVFESGNIPTALKNTVIVTIFVLLIEIVAGGLAAYPLSRNKSNGTAG